MYTNGKPKGEVAKFIAFVKSPKGQEIVKKEGFVPLTASKESKKAKK
jgi:phosphate transport system substrate-binding protein